MSEYGFTPTRLPVRAGRPLVQGATFTETLVLTIVNQMLQMPSELLVERREVINSVLLANLYGEMMKSPAKEKAFLECLKKIWRDMFPKVLFPEKELRLFDLKQTLFTYLWEHREEWIPYSELRYDEKIREKVWDKVNDLIFTTIIAFLKVTGALR